MTAGPRRLEAAIGDIYRIHLDLGSGFAAINRGWKPLPHTYQDIMVPYVKIYFRNAFAYNSTDQK